MLPLLLSVCLVIISGNSATITSLMDLPLNLPKGNYIIDATLKDLSNGDKYFMKEFISSKSTINGMIVVDSPKNTFNVYYNMTDGNGKDSDERKVIMGIDCSLYKLSSSQLLPGINKRLTSLLVAMGPSILYRLGHSSLIREKSDNENVRGKIMKSFTADINDKLNITYYYKSNLDKKSGLQAPSRIAFSGSDPSSILDSMNEDLILDIYYQKSDSTKDLSKTVNPLPGIGCSTYYEDTLPLPTLNSHLVHFILSETITGATTTKSISEIHANDKLKLMRLKTSPLGVEMEALYDYSLGIVNIFQDGGSCNISIAEKTSPGVDQLTNQFSLKTLLLLDGHYRYLGEMVLENRPGFAVKAWESIRYNTITNNDKYDKVVVTQYFTETTSKVAFNGYLIVATIINCYRLDTKQKLQLVEVIQRDYLDFRVVESESKFHDKFSLAGCKYFTGDKTLTFQLGCQAPNCMKFAEDNVYALKEHFRQSLLINYDLSPLRIIEMAVTFSTLTIDIRIDFLEAPNLLDVFSPKTYSVSDNTFKSLSRTVKTAGEIDCLSILSTDYSDFDIVLFCPTINICGIMKGIENVKEDDKKGQACQVFQIPLHNLNRMVHEITNKDLQSRLLRDTAYKTVSLTDRFWKPVDYKVIDIIDETRDQTDHSGNLFRLSHSDEKLRANDPNVAVAANVKTFSDFTNMTPQKAPIDLAKSDSNCAVYTKNNLLDYSVIRNRQFKSLSSIPLELNVYQCASECSSDENCVSFQSCGTTCTMGGFYTDSGTEYDSDCEIYIPKVSNMYQPTGRKLVSETFHLYDQCAALCYSWTDDLDSCQSFNFCPTGRSTSTCSLSKYSVKDSKTATTDATNCSNYELVKNSNKKRQPAPTEKKGTSGSAAFGIILIFIATGFLFGIGLPIAYLKMKTLSSRIAQGTWNEQSFTWERQVNDEEPEADGYSDYKSNL
ncbi:uncharacterized protein LOC128389697 [Panonychus citri]|uniref:uncharacterized protein LOC128389697 n=1 Tax=Panonychus citri TaxID=50023 RepID=UPI002307DA24|nr:uncharacterized protein LOC128389697 [Panonychus citri]